MEPLPLAWIDRVWERLFAFYGSRFTDFWNGADEKQIISIKRIWSEELSGYSAAEIKMGLEGCKKKDYPPSLPQFLMMCRPPINYEVAFCEAIKQLQMRKEGMDKWSSPAIYYAAITMSYELNNSTYDAVKGRWKNAIDVAVEEIKSGKIPNEVPERKVALVAPGETKISAEKALANIEKLKVQLGSIFKPMEG